MQAILVMFRSNGERRSFSVTREITVIGRREDCDLLIPLGEVSRKHCRLVRDGDLLKLEDLGSANGTFLNGQRVQESLLAPGDTVQVGPVVFVLQIDGTPEDDELQPIYAEGAMMAGAAAVGAGAGAAADVHAGVGDDEGFEPTDPLAGDYGALEEDPGGLEELEPIADEAGDLAAAPAAGDAGGEDDDLGLLAAAPVGSEDPDHAADADGELTGELRGDGDLVEALSDEEALEMAGLEPEGTEDVDADAEASAADGEAAEELPSLAVEAGGAGTDEGDDLSLLAAAPTGPDDATELEDENVALEADGGSEGINLVEPAALGSEDDDGRLALVEPASAEADADDAGLGLVEPAAEGESEEMDLAVAATTEEDDDDELGTLAAAAAADEAGDDDDDELGTLAAAAAADEESDDELTSPPPLPAGAGADAEADDVDELAPTASLATAEADDDDETEDDATDLDDTLDDLDDLTSLDSGTAELAGDDDDAEGEADDESNLDDLEPVAGGPLHEVSLDGPLVAEASAADPMDLADLDLDDAEHELDDAEHDLDDAEHEPKPR